MKLQDWYAGLAEWTPLSAVPELHSHLGGGMPQNHSLDLRRAVELHPRPAVLLVAE